ncbi:bestrophin [Geobacter sp. FeAm09]|uniref:bestrophin family protein n=1 Tax=Geobacter sp. FeAm09 TaxID=2597769 RepID=UPI0011ED0390|nr:bestrophin family ion channel [Geobacter sp. FeAm09]QEM69374.1 bestrophin [Geobacter sp. FeAm09]
MIVRERPSGLRLYFIFKGSMLQSIRWQLVSTVLVAAAVYLTHGMLFAIKITMTPIPFSLIGLALAIFLGFRNNASYERYWEGRKLWGELMIACRTVTRQMQTFVGGNDAAEARRRMAYRAIAFAHALRHHLRGSDPREEVGALLTAGERTSFEGAVNKPDFLVRRMAADLRGLADERAINPLYAARIDETLTSFATILAGCERIKQTPIPFSYTLLIHRTAYLYCFMLPFGLVDSIGFMTPFVVGLISYTFFGLDALGDEIAEPFGTLPNDLPLAGICRGIEISVREALGEEELPEALAPVDFCIL